MQNVAEGQEFGPVTDKLIHDLLAAGMRLTGYLKDHPDQVAVQMHAYTVEITTALALAVGKLELAQDASPAPARRRARAASLADYSAPHLSLVPLAGEPVGE